MNRFCLLVFFIVLILQKAVCAGGPVFGKLTANPVGLNNKGIDSLNRLAQKLYLTNPIRARKIAENTLLAAKKSNYAIGIGQSYYNIGICYWAQSYYPISLFYLNSALPYLSTNHLYHSGCYRYIARNYFDLKEFKPGFDFLSRAQKEAGSDMESQGDILTDRSLAYYRLKKFDLAAADAYKAIAICKKIKKRPTVAILYNRLFYVFEKTRQFEKAGAYCDSSLQMSIATHNIRLKSVSLMGRAYLFFDQQKYKPAADNAQKAWMLADSIGVMEIASNARKLLANIYQKTGDNKNALLFANQYIKLQDSLNNADKENSVELIQDYFALTGKLNDIEQIEQKSKLDHLLIQSQRNTIINLGVSILVLIALLAILYRYYTQKNKLSRQLGTQNKEVVEQNRVIATQSEHLDELNNLKDRMLAIIGHDLGAPLANLRNIIDLFGQGYFTADEVQRMVNMMEPAVKGAELTLSNLVQWAGSQFKGDKVTPIRVDLLSVMEETRSIFTHPLSLKHLRLVNNLEKGQFVWADENHVKMIIRNLMSNAVKFTPEHGVITVSAQQQADKLVISVADTGKGMTREEADRLFATDTHFSKPGTRGEKGTGIGLLLCRQLAELNGGHIGVTSAPGLGSTFFISLPLS